MHRQSTTSDGAGGGAEIGMGAEETYQRIMRKLQRQASYDAPQQASGTSSAHVDSQSTTKVGDTPHSPLKPSEVEEDEEERRFGMIPVPGSLRLLIENVKSTVDEKMTVAGISSLKDCMRYVFECRGLLDKLLKDLPQHGNYVEARSSAAQLQEWFQEFRKIPILLPVAGYQRQEGTGKYLPELTQRAGPGGADGLQRSGTFASPTTAAAPQQQQLQSEGAFGGPPMPPRTRGAGGGQSVISPRGQVLSPAAVRRTSLQSSNSSTVARGAIGAATARGAAAGGGSIVSGSSTAGGYHHAPPLQSRDHALLMKHLRRQTQLIDGSAQTDESEAKIVKREDYEQATRRVTQLENLVSQHEDAVDRLTAQLDAARGALAHRSKTIQYLRTTLHKECCLLRQQLAMVQARQAVPGRNMSIVTAPMDGSVSYQASDLVTSSTFSATQRGGGGGGGGGADITAVHSLLDLVLLAVEKDKQIDENGELVMNAREEVAKLQEQLRERQIKARHEQSAMRMKFMLMMSEKNKQLHAMKLSTDTVRMRTALFSVVGQLRDEFHTLRFSVKEVLNVMTSSLFNITNEIDFAVKNASVELSELRMRQATQTVVADALKAAEGLFLPMLRPEFALGCHMWEHTRQPEPLRSYVSHRYGPELVHKVGPELYSLQHIYTNLQRFVLQMFQKPDPQKPLPGMTMERLASMMLLADECTPEHAVTIRRLLRKDAEFASHIARLNFVLKGLTMRQVVVLDRCRGAIIEAGKDPAAITLPVQTLVNRIGMRVSAARFEKSQVAQQRGDNARSLWQLWKESAIDIYRGKTPVITKDPGSLWVPSAPRANRLTKRKQQLGGVLPGAGTTPTMPSIGAVGPSPPATKRLSRPGSGISGSRPASSSSSSAATAVWRHSSSGSASAVHAQQSQRLAHADGAAGDGFHGATQGAPAHSPLSPPDSSTL